jgi:hypothetical protein
MIFSRNSHGINITLVSHRCNSDDISGTCWLECSELKVLLSVTSTRSKLERACTWRQFEIFLSTSLIKEKSQMVCEYFATNLEHSSHFRLDLFHVSLSTFIFGIPKSGKLREEPTSPLILERRSIEQPSSYLYSRLIKPPESSCSSNW